MIAKNLRSYFIKNAITIHKINMVMKKIKVVIIFICKIFQSAVLVGEFSDGQEKNLRSNLA